MMTVKIVKDLDVAEVEVDHVEVDVVEEVHSVDEAEEAE